MNEQDWAPEPWEWLKDHGDIHDANGNDVYPSQNDADAIRTVACVNACAGIPTEDLLIIANGYLIACKHCGHKYRTPFEGCESVFDGVMLKCPACKKESDWPKAEWPTVKEAADG